MQFISKKIEVCRCERSEYEQFEQLHYLKGICKGASCFIFKIDGVVGAFASLLAMPLREHTNALIFHRIVVLEQFQGLGLSSMIVNLLGGIFKAIGKDVYLKTDSTRMGKMLRNNSQWAPTLMNRRTRKLTKHDHERNKARHRRAAFSFKFVGCVINNYDSITKPIQEIREGNLLGKYILVNTLDIIKSAYRVDNPEFLRDALCNDFDTLSDTYEGIYGKVSQHSELYTTNFVIRRKSQTANHEYLKRLLFINGLLRLIHHHTTDES